VSTVSRAFAYCRVSTSEQTTDNQIQEIASAGFSITHQDTIDETVTGSVAAAGGDPSPLPVNTSDNHNFVQLQISAKNEDRKKLRRHPAFQSHRQPGQGG
jgi:hypothetical protein